MIDTKKLKKEAKKSGISASALYVLKKLTAMISKTESKLLAILAIKGLNMRALKGFDIVNSEAGDDLYFMAKKSGLSGNDISLDFKDPEAPDAVLGVVVTGKAIVVSLGTDGSSVLNSTLQEVVDVLKKHKDVAFGSVTRLNSGTAIVDTAVGPTNLENGEMIVSL